jgi:dihydrofolate reductase
MHISSIVAASENNVIGIGNRLPWHLPDDLKHFKTLTLGKPVVMGRKTYESIGRPLPGRANIVISRHSELQIHGAAVYSSLESAFAALTGVPEICVIGGAEIFHLAMPLVDTIHLTRVHVHLVGDVYLPTLSLDSWHETQREEHAADDRHAHSFTFLTLERKRNGKLNREKVVLA